jgi:release factor glutamine methyltransferase
MTSRDHDQLVERLRAAGCVFAEDEASLLIAAAKTPAELTAMVDQRVAGLPLEPILGWAEFCGLRVLVSPGVFVPRRRTELLVSEAVGVVRAAGPGAVLVDLCCGTGAVALAVAAAVPGLELYAVDVEPHAVACARRNLERVGGRVYAGDLFEPLGEQLHGRIDVLVANAPYVPSDAVALMPPEARLHEPRVALDGGADGLDVQRRVIAEAGRWLAAYGHLLIETSEEQAPITAVAYERAGFTVRIAHSDELDATVVVGSRQ